MKKTNRKMRKLVNTPALATAGVACQATDTAKASDRFTDCLQRNGVEAEDVEVVMSDGVVESLTLVVVDEGEARYEPTVRLVCTLELEAEQLLSGQVLRTPRRSA